MAQATNTLHGIIDELNITSLDDSDLDAGLQDYTSEDGESGASLTGTSGRSCMGDSSPGSVASSDVRAALAEIEVPADAELDEGNFALEQRLRLTGIERSTLRPPLVREAGEQSQHQHQLTSAVMALAQEQAQLAERVSASRQDAGRAALPGDTAAMQSASSVFRFHMSDLTISEAEYQTLRTKPDDELNVREWVQLRFFEVRNTHKLEAERLRREVDALRDSACATQTRAERAERQLGRCEAVVEELKRELSAERSQISHLTSELKARDGTIADIQDKGRRFDTVYQEAEHLREEVSTLLKTMSEESAASQRLARDHADTVERLMHLETELSLLRKDADSHERRARLLEDTLAQRDQDNADLRTKVASLKEKKQELVRKVTAEQTTTAQDVREQVDTEIKRLQEQARAELEVVRTNLNALHTKEVEMLQERADQFAARNAELQRRLDDEEQAHQSLQLSFGRVRAELQNEITELCGALKLRAFEAERTALMHEEISQSRSQLEADNEILRKQVDVLKNEHYSLEAQHREARAGERAELSSLREQLRSYQVVENELDAAIRACAGPRVPGLPADAEGQPPQSVDEALLLGTTLASAPTSAQRRIQQSLLLAQELQRRSRDLAEVKERLKDKEGEAAKLVDELEAARQEVQYRSQPQAYIIEALRQREQEVGTLRRQMKTIEGDLDRSRLQVEQAVAKQLQSEGHLKQLLTQRQQLDGLCAMLASPGGQAGGHDVVASGRLEQLRVAEHRGRAPSQQPQGLGPPPPSGTSAQATEGNAARGGASGPAWLGRLKASMAGAGASPKRAPTDGRSEDVQ